MIHDRFRSRECHIKDRVRRVLYPTDQRKLKQLDLSK